MTRRPRFTHLNLERLEDRNAASDTLGVLLAGLYPALDGPLAPRDSLAPPFHSWLGDERPLFDSQEADSSRTVNVATEERAPSLENKRHGLEEPAGPLDSSDVLRDPFLAALGGVAKSTENPAAAAAFMGPSAIGRANEPADSEASNVVKRSHDIRIEPSSAAESQTSDPMQFGQPIGFDADGVSAATEAQAANNGDGNRDGIADARQGDVASLRAGVGGSSVTVEAAGHELRNVRAIAPTAALAGDRAMPLGLFAFDVYGVVRGGSTSVRLFLPDGHITDTYYKRDAAGAFERFDYDGETGATFDDTIVTLHLKDGGRGDADGVANGIIKDPGGPGPIIMAVKVREVTFSGLDQITITADPESPQYTDPAWYDVNLNGAIDSPQDHSWPLAYPLDSTKVKVSARFTIINSVQMPGQPVYKIKASPTLMTLNAHYFIVPPTTVAMDTGDIYLAEMLIVDPFPDLMNYGLLNLNWEFSSDNGASYTNAGTTFNELYVTLAKPESAIVYHSALHLSVPVSVAGGALTEAQVIEDTWINFQTRNITNRHAMTAHDGFPLTYYWDWDVTNNDIATLLEHTDGKCGAFALLFVNAIRAAGVQKATTPITKIEVKSKTMGESFLVNNWQFNGPSGAGQYPYVNRLFNGNSDPESQNSWMQEQNGIWSFYWAANPAPDVIDQGGASGQSISNPKSLFRDHSLIRIGAKVYDPSYGTGPFNDLAAWEAASVSGFVIAVVEANANRLQFRKNLAPEDMEIDAESEE